MMSDKRLFLVNASCPECPDHAVRSVLVDLLDVEAGAALRVFSAVCGHIWDLPPDEAAKIKKAL
jgi:hypothetical protein